jgi:hypothetical protein
MQVRHACPYGRELRGSMLLVRQQNAGRRKEHRTVNYMAALMVANHEAFLGPKARSEAISSKPGIGDKARSALQELRSRLTVDVAEGPATPALLDYPYRS